MKVRLVDVEVNFRKFVKDIITEEQYLERTQARLFNIGTRVVSVVDEAGVKVGYLGTVCNMDSVPSYIGVHFDKDIGGHSCEGTCPPANGRNMTLGQVKIIES